MGYFEHLEELRWVLFKMLGAIAVCSILGWVFYDPIFTLLMRPLESVRDQVTLFNATPVAGFLIKLKFSLLSGAVLSLPLLFHFAWGFIAPALTPRERRLGTGVMTAGTFFFLLGTAFAYQLLEYILQFLIRFTPKGTESIWTITSYTDFVIRTELAFGVLFELPVVMVLLVALGVVDTASLARVRRYAIVGCFLAAAILTPPDVFSQLMLGGPLILLYELGLLVGKLVEKRRGHHDADTCQD
jgi:sec-independent protein translocase protein TatC